MSAEASTRHIYIDRSNQQKDVFESQHPIQHLFFITGFADEYLSSRGAAIDGMHGKQASAHRHPDRTASREADGARDCQP